MDHTAHPAPLAEALESIDLGDLLEGFIARERVGVRFLEIERAAQRYGYRFERRGGNLYGALRLVAAPITPAPALRVVTRSDVAAVHGSRRRAA